MLPAQGASIALFMLLAAMVTPQAPSGGVGLRTGLGPGTPSAGGDDPHLIRSSRGRPSGV